MIIDRLFSTTQNNTDEKYCVYCHRNKINGKRYIGQTMYQDKPELRFGSNGNGYKSHILFYRAIQKYGWDAFDHYIIQDNLTKEEADELEILNIAVYNTTDNRFGYNIAIGGQGGSHRHNCWVHKDDEVLKVFPEEIDYYISIGYSTGRPATGISPSKEHIESLRYSLFGNKHTLGKKWINKNGEHKVVDEDKVQEYLNNGWSIGRTKTKQSENTERKRCFVHKGKYQCLVYTDEIDQYISNGFSLGKSTSKQKHITQEHKDKISKKNTERNTGRVWITDGKNNKFVTKEDIDKYPDYHLGRYAPKKTNGNIGCVWVTNGENTIRIHKDNVPEYRALGYVRGRSLKKVV